MEPRFSVLISTIDDRIISVPNILMPPDEQLCYIVVWQLTHEPSVEAQKSLLLLEREDINVIPVNGEGLSISRNIALRTCQTPYAILADDDVRYTKDAFDRIRTAIDENPDADVLCFQAIDSQGRFLKDYPFKTIPYAKWPRGYMASSVEIVLRLRYDTPCFDPRFGLGSPFLVCGEEDVFLHECAARGHRVIFVPETICTTDGQTTSTRFARHPKFLRSKGAALRVVHGWTGAWLRILKYTLQAPKGEKMWRFKLLTQGIRYIQRTPPPQVPISVIIPYLNRAKTLPRLFESLLAVDYSLIEVILVDNGSTDDSLRICEEFRKKYSNRFCRVAVLSEPERNASAARNRGLLSARGRYVYFFDSDDEISPTFFSEAAPYIDRYDLICARTKMVFENGYTKVRWRKRPTTPAAHILGGVLSTQTCLIRRSLFLKTPANQGWNQCLTRWDDLEMGLRLLLAARNIKWLDTVHHRIHRHTDSLSGKSLWDDRDAVLKALTAIRLDLSEQKEVMDAKQLQQAWNALAARTLLACSRMLQESAEKTLNEDEKRIVAFIVSLGNPHFLKRIRMVGKFWPRWMPGMWRALLALT